MKGRRLVSMPHAQTDLRWIYDVVEQAAGPETALRYVERIETYLRGFEYAAERGTRRDDVRKGLRTVGFERRVTVTFTVQPNEVVIFRPFYGGADWQTQLSDD